MLRRKIIKKLLRESDWDWAKEILDPLDDLSDELIKRRVKIGPIRIGFREGCSYCEPDTVYIGDKVKYLDDDDNVVIFTLEYLSDDKWGGWGSDATETYDYKKYIDNTNDRNHINLGFLVRA